MEHSFRAQDGGPALIRLLAYLGGAAASPPSQALAPQLAQWIEWRQAVALSSALEAQPSACETDVPTGTDGDEDCAQVRASLVRSIDGDRAFTTASADAAFFRQRCQLLQQVMGAEVGLLRKRLRERLARRSTAFARLAAADAAMEQALAPRERASLAAVPEMLGRHFERLRDAQPASGDTAAPWLDAFRRDMRALLVAELDLRLQPTRGLSAALRTDTAGPHAE